MRFMLYRLLVACAVLSLIGCSLPEHKEQAMRIGTHKWIGYETLTLADKLGEYKDANLRLVRLASASDLMHAIRSENLEAATLTLDETLTLISEGFKLDVIAIFDFSKGGDAVITKEYITKPSELKGKTIAVEFVATGAIMLDALLESAGLTLEDVTIIPCTIDQHAECFETSDAVITFEPYRSQLVGLGGKIIFDSSAIPERIVDVLVVKHTAIEKHSDAIHALVKGYCNALEHLEKNYVDALQIVAEALQVSPKTADQAYGLVTIPSVKQNIEFLSGTPSKLDQRAQSLAQFMQSRSLLNEVKLPFIANNQFVKGCLNDI